MRSTHPSARKMLQDCYTIDHYIMCGTEREQDQQFPAEAEPLATSDPAVTPAQQSKSRCGCGRACDSRSCAQPGLEWIECRRGKNTWIKHVPSRRGSRDFSVAGAGWFGPVLPQAVMVSVIFSKTLDTSHRCSLIMLETSSTNLLRDRSTAKRRSRSLLQVPASYRRSWHQSV